MVRVLYRPHGGAYFLCRHCWHIGYASQYESATDRMWRRYHRASALLDAAQSPAELQRAERVLSSCFAAINAETDAAHAVLEAMQAQDTRTPRRPGRPSKRAEREAERAARAAARPVRPKRPSGRPRTRRAYHRAHLSCALSVTAGCGAGLLPTLPRSARVGGRPGGHLPQWAPGDPWALRGVSDHNGADRGPRSIAPERSSIILLIGPDGHGASTVLVLTALPGIGHRRVFHFPGARPAGTVKRRTDR